MQLEQIPHWSQPVEYLYVVDIVEVDSKLYQLGISDYIQVVGLTSSSVPFYEEIVDLRGIPLKKLLCINHCVALSEKGQMYVWGENTSKQCGFSKYYITKPMLLKCPIAITDIAIGTYHTVFVTGKKYLRKNLWFEETQLVFGMGDNRCGQLGKSNPKRVNLPTRIKELNAKEISKLYAGGRRTMCISNSGKVFALGDNKYVFKNTV